MTIIQTEMKLYTNTEFDGHWPVGSAAIVLAETTQQAANMLEAELEKIGLKQKVYPEDFDEISLEWSTVKILCDGNY